MRLYWIRWVLIQWLVSLWEEGNLDTEKDRGECHVNLGTETVSTNQGTPRMAGNHHKVGKMPRTHFPSEPPEDPTLLTPWFGLYHPDCERIHVCRKPSVRSTLFERHRKRAHRALWLGRQETGREGRWPATKSGTSTTWQEYYPNQALAVNPLLRYENVYHWFLAVHKDRVN